MNPTEISEHAEHAFDWYVHCETAGTIDAIQHGINLAVESKDRRISELEAIIRTSSASTSMLVDDLKLELKSKDREIERLKADLIDITEDRNLAEQLLEKRDSNLTEANAKLSEAEKELSIEHMLIQIEELRSKDREISELKTVAREMVSELDREIKRIQKEWDASEKARASNLSQLSSAQAEIERLKAVPCCSGNFACGGICPICNAITTGNQ